MTGFYDRAKATAGRLLAASGKGQAVTLTHKTTATYNPSSGLPAPSTSTQTGAGVEDDYRSWEIDGTVIVQGDKKFTLSPLNSAGSAITVPSVGDTVLIGAVSWRIMSVSPYAPAGTVLYIVLQLRRG